jgi:Spy/CpxP family protein refolding chaperone
MKRRTIIGMVAVLVSGALVGASAFAFGGPAHRASVMKRFVAAAIDDALEEAAVTPEQRAVIYGVRDRVFAAVEEHRKARRPRLEEALRLFEADEIDASQVAALREQGEADHKKLVDTVSQAIREIHDVLTPGQRKVVADYVRSHRRHM